MAAEIFTALSALRMVLNTETDADSPDNETTYAAIRKMIETLYMLAFSTGITGSLTSDPPDDTTGVATDSAKSWDVDLHNGRSLLFTSGNAKGNLYTIDDTTATTVICTDDNLYAAGARSGDDYIILFDIKVNADGHDHDGVNSKGATVDDLQITEAKLAASAVAQAKLKTSQGSVNSSNAGNLTLPGGEYGFYPQIKQDVAEAWSYYIGYEIMSAAYVTNVAVQHGSPSQTAYVQQRYVTSSGEIHWLFVLIEKGTGKRLAMYQAPDHPCFGNRGVQHPFPDFDAKKHEIIVINPAVDVVKGIELARAEEDYLKPETDFLQKFFELYEIDELRQADWPDIPVTVGLPRVHEGRIVDDWRFMPRGMAVNPVKRVIPKPGFITPLGVKNRK